MQHWMQDAYNYRSYGQIIKEWLWYNVIQKPQVFGEAIQNTTCTHHMQRTMGMNNA